MSEQVRETVTAEEVCKILHIGKRKCAWMLQNGMIPCEDTGKKTRKRNPYYLAPDEVPADFRAWLDDEWYKMADTVTAWEIGELLGYDSDSVRRWINRGWLKVVHAHGREIIAREWLMDFMCGHGFAIVRKSEQHVELLWRYFDGEA